MLDYTHLYLPPSLPPSLPSSHTSHSPSICFVLGGEDNTCLQLIVFLIHDLHPFQNQKKITPFHNLLNFWCHFHSIITPGSCIFISQRTWNENIRPWHHFCRIKIVFNFMSLAVKQHCSRDVIRTNLSFFFYFGDIAETCGTFVIRRGDESVWTPLPSISELLWMAFREINGVGGTAVWLWWNRMQMWLQGIQVRKQSFPKHTHTHTHTQ